MHTYGWALAIWAIASLLIPAKARSGFVCLPRPVKFDTCTSIRLLGPCQTDQDCDTQVCCKDWCGNYCAFKQRSKAVGDDNRDDHGGGRAPGSRGGGGRQGAMADSPVEGGEDYDVPAPTETRRKGRKRRRRLNHRRRVEAGQVERKRRDEDDHEYFEI